MSERLKGLREKRGKAIADMQAILDTIEARENDEGTAEELANHARLFDEQERLRKEIEAEERQQDLAREEAARVAAAEGAPAEVEDRAGAMGAFRNYLRSGNIAGAGADELRALQADADTEGGFLVVPEEFVRLLIKFMDDAVFVRGLATVIPVINADSLGIPSLDTDIADADWTTELLTGTEDSSMALGKRSLEPHPLAKLIKVSNKLLRIGAIPVEQLVNDRLGYKFAITQEKAYLTGTGAGQPLGLFTASGDGISTGRDVSTGNTTTALTFDGLIEAKFSVKGGYWRNARWLFHRDAVKMITKLKDGEGRYLWQQSVQDGGPDMILGRPVDMSEYVPNTFTTGLYVGMFGDFSHYWIVDSLQLQVQRLVELYAATNQVGFIGRYEGDGMPVLEEAFARVTLT
mgnify:CR=1 FL=1